MLGCPRFAISAPFKPRLSGVYLDVYRASIDLNFPFAGAAVKQRWSGRGKTVDRLRVVREVLSGRTQSGIRVGRELQGSSLSVGRQIASSFAAAPTWEENC